MNCKETILELSAYLDNEVSDATRVSIETHVASCSACRARLQELQRINNGIAALASLPASVDIADNVRRRIRTGTATPHSPSWWEWLTQPAWMKLPVQAVALVALVVGIAMLIRQDRDQHQMTVSNMKKLEVAQQNEVTAPSDISVPGVDKEIDRVVAADALQEETRRRITEDNRPIVRGPPPTATPAAPPAAVEIADAGRRDLSLAKQKVSKPESVSPAVLEVASLDVALVRQQVAQLAAELNGQLVPHPADERAAFESEGTNTGGKTSTKKDAATAVIEVDLPAAKLDQFKTTLSQRIEVASRDRKTVTEGRESVVAGGTVGTGAAAPATIPPAPSSPVGMAQKAQTSTARSEAKDSDIPDTLRWKRGAPSKGEAGPSEPRALLDSASNLPPVITTETPAELPRITLIIKVVPPSSPLP